MSAAASKEENNDVISSLYAIGFISCLFFLVVMGIFSWLRKRASVDWWRGRCGCLGGDGNRSLPTLSPAYGMKSADTMAPTHPVARRFDHVQTRVDAGLDNPSFEPQPTEVHGITVETADHPTRIPHISITMAPPDYYSLETSQFRHSQQMTDGRQSVVQQRSRLSTGETRIHKVVRKASITSDYVSDVESEYNHPLARMPTGGRYSNRRMGEKKRQRRKHRAKSGTRTSQKIGQKYAATSLTNLASNIDLGKPVTRRHSLAVTHHSEPQQDYTRKPIPPARTKRKRSASDAHLLASIRNSLTETPATNDDRLRSTSVRHSASVRLGQSGVNEHLPSVGTMPRKSSSLNPFPTKSATGLVRSETILELAIYKKTDGLVSTRLETNEAENKRHSRGFREGKAPRPKPPRSRAGREHKHSRQSVPNSKREKWPNRYRSLPGDLRKIDSSVLDQMGMTQESFVESIGTLDFEKLFRPVPHISDDQRQASPRKPIAEDHMPDHEQEILKNTYKLEEFGIVTTDL